MALSVTEYDYFSGEEGCLAGVSGPGRGVCVCDFEHTLAFLCTPSYGASRLGLFRRHPRDHGQLCPCLAPLLQRVGGGRPAEARG